MKEKILEQSEEVNIERLIDNFESITKNAERVQKMVLHKILKENGSAEYLQNFGLNGRTDPESFKACVPVCTHNDLEPYIYRIVDGDNPSSLTEKPITRISLSSGTTQGKPKFVPFNDGLIETTVQIYQTSFAYRNREFPLDNGRALQFIYSSKQFLTKGGLTAGTATTHVFRNPRFKTVMKGLQSRSCSPDEVIFAPDFNQSLYCHLLCGLIYWNEVQIVSSTFANSILHAFRTFEQVWEQLYVDIKEGNLNSRITVPSVRAAMSRILKPNPELADMFYTKVSRLTDWYGLIPTLFPNAKYIYGIMTGSMEPYLRKLRHYAGNLPLISGDYGSSEGWIGANINPKLPPELVTFVVLPDIGFFEFIPLSESNKDQGQEKIVGLTEVNIGEEYEVVLTTVGGLYRYMLGDVVKVMGFHNSTPQLKFICRRNLLLSIYNKTTEKDLQLAVEQAADKLFAKEKLEIYDFTSHVDTSTEPGHYVIFWEIIGEPSDEVLQECCDCLDNSFAGGYIKSRKVNSIGPLELRILQKGTFQKMVDHYVGMGAAVSQMKTSRCVGSANGVVLKILTSNVTKSYFSTAFN